jgi:hypothetical protein
MGYVIPIIKSTSADIVCIKKVNFDVTKIIKGCFLYLNL